MAENQKCMVGFSFFALYRRSLSVSSGIPYSRTVMDTNQIHDRKMPKAQCELLSGKLSLLLINLLHLGGLISSSLHFLKWRQVVIISKSLIIIVNAQAKLDHAMDAASELGGFIQIETRCEERGVEEQPNQILHGLVRFVCSCLLPSGCIYAVLQSSARELLAGFVWVLGRVLIVQTSIKSRNLIQHPHPSKLHVLNDPAGAQELCQRMRSIVTEKLTTPQKGSNPSPRCIQGS